MENIGQKMVDAYEEKIHGKEYVRKRKEKEKAIQDSKSQAVKLITLIIAFFLRVLLVMVLWNSLVPILFAGVMTFTYLQVLGLLFLGKLIVGSFIS